jgi:hypothetical protein
LFRGFKKKEKMLSPFDFYPAYKPTVLLPTLPMLEGRSEGNPSGNEQDEGDEPMHVIDE